MFMSMIDFLISHKKFQCLSQNYLNWLTVVSISISYTDYFQTTSRVVQVLLYSNSNFDHISYTCLFIDLEG